MSLLLEEGLFIRDVRGLSVSCELLMSWSSHTPLMRGNMSSHFTRLTNQDLHLGDCDFYQIPCIFKGICKGIAWFLLGAVSA